MLGVAGGGAHTYLEAVVVSLEVVASQAEADLLEAEAAALVSNLVEKQIRRRLKQTNLIEILCKKKWCVIFLF